MLFGQHRRRHQHRHLLTIHYRLERSPDRYLGLAVTDIATYQAVHGLCIFHIFLDLPLDHNLVGCFHVWEGCFHFLLPHGIFRKGKTGNYLTAGVQRYQFIGDIFDSFLYLALGSRPFLCTQAA